MAFGRRQWLHGGAQTMDRGQDPRVVDPVAANLVRQADPIEHDRKITG